MQPWAKRNVKSFHVKTGESRIYTTGCKWEGDLMLLEIAIGMQNN